MVEKSATRLQNGAVKEVGKQERNQEREREQLGIAWWVILSLIKLLVDD